MKVWILSTASVAALSACAVTAASAQAATAQQQPPTASASAAPASPPTPAGDGLGDIVVTARRVNENLEKVPVAVTALSAAALQQRNVAAVNDLQFSVPNLQIKPNQTYSSQPDFTIRGQRQILFTDENVVTYVDGVAQGTRGLTLYDLDSVQVLKGPQGTLFGKNSMGGAVVVTTAEPKFKSEAQMTLEVGNYNRVQGTVMANVPIVDDKVALRLNGQIERQQGFFKNLNPGYSDLNNRHNESGRASLLIKPVDRLRNTTVVDYIHRDEIPAPWIIEAAPLDGNVFRSVTQQAVTQQSELGGATPYTDTADGLLVRRGDPFRSVAQTGTGPGAYLSGNYRALSSFAAQSSIWGVANTTTYDLGDDFSIKNIFGYRHEKALDYQDPSAISGMTFDFSDLFGAPPGSITGQATNNDTYYINTLRSLSEELQLIGKIGDLKFIAGGYYSHQNRTYQVNTSFVVGPASFYGPLFDRYDSMLDKVSSAAAFAQGTYDFGGIGIDGLKLTAGARYTRISNSADNTNFFTDQATFYQDYRPSYGCNLLNETEGNTVSVNDGANCEVSSKRVYKALTWTASLDYQLTPSTLVYFANRRGFKAGNPDPQTRVLKYFMFGPERITDFELGFKSQGRIGTIPYRVNIAGFIGKYKQIQTQDILQFCSNPAADPADGVACGSYTDLIVFNVGQATIKGVEAEGSIKPIRQLELNVGYSYQVGRYGNGSIVPQPANPALPVADTNPIDFSGGENLSGKEFAGVPRTTLNVSGTYTMDFIPYTFAKTSLSANFYYRSKTTGLAVQGIYKTPSFDTLGLRLSLDNLFQSQFSAALWASNVTNNFYRLACSDNLNSIGYAACRWGDPRTYGMTITAKF